MNTTRTPQSRAMPEKGFLKRPLTQQLVRYAVTGVLNTAIDFILLFILLRITGITEGAALFGLNIVSFSVATTNSYFFNKYWTFKNRSRQQATQFSQFFVVSIIGAFINSGLVALIASNIDPLFGVSQETWALLAKVVATGASLIWNFLGYKLIVFRIKQKPELPSTQE